MCKRQTSGRGFGETPTVQSSTGRRIIIGIIIVITAIVIVILLGRFLPSYSSNVSEPDDIANFGAATDTFGREPERRVDTFADFVEGTPGKSDNLSAIEGLYGHRSY